MWKKKKEGKKEKKRKTRRKTQKRREGEEKSIFEGKMEKKKKCLPCFCSVSCAQLSFTLEPDDGLCAHVDELDVHTSHHCLMSRLV